jgi:hypothetical protein
VELAETNAGSVCDHTRGYRSRARLARLRSAAASIAARIFQMFFLISGLALLATSGLVVMEDEFNDRELAIEWPCTEG